MVPIIIIIMKKTGFADNQQYVNIIHKIFLF